MFVPRAVGRSLGPILLSLPLAGLAVAELTDLERLMQRVEQLEASDRAKKQRIAELQGQLEENWLTERRAQEIRGLAQEVFADAETRASLLAEGATAGIDEKGKIFLKSADGSFYTHVSGQIQMRYIYNYQDSDDPVTARTDQSEDGFQMRRTKVQLAGHIGDPKITYVVRFASSRSSANTSLEEAKIGYGFDNGLYILAGKMKLPFTREELLSSKRMLTVERSSVNEYYTLNFAEQIQLGYEGKRFRMVGAISDGANSESSEFNADAADVAVTGRVDLLLDGKWSQMKDYTSWRGEDQAAFLGAAAHYEVVDGANNPGSLDGEYLSLTADASYENNGLGLYAAYAYSHFEDEADAPMPLGSDLTTHGLIVQGGYRVTDQLEPFARYEWLDADDDDEFAISGSERDAVQIVTVGANYYLKKHTAKFTGDVVYVLDGDAPVSNAFGANAFSSSLGFNSFSSAEADPNVILRLQFQLLF